MTAKVPTIRAALHDAIAAKKIELEFIVNDFDLREAAKKTFDLEELQTARVTVIGAGFRERVVTRRRGTQAAKMRAEIPVYVFLQKALSDPDTPGAGTLADVDVLLLLQEQLMETAAEVDVPGFTFLENDNPSGEDGLPYDFQKLHETDAFDGVFVARYERVPLS